MGIAGRLKIISAIVALLLIILAVLVVLPRQVTAQSNSCPEAVGGCNYEFTNITNVMPNIVSVTAVITSTMTVQSYSNNLPIVSLQYNPDLGMVFNNPGSTKYWVQGIIAYYVTSDYPGGPGSTGNLYLLVQIYNSSGDLVWTNSRNPTYKDVPWPLVSAPQWNINAQWYIEYDIGSNGLISEVCEEVEIPIAYETYDTFSQCISIPSQYSNYWYRSNVVWAGANGGIVYFNSGGSGYFQFCSNVTLYQGPLADNTAEGSNVAYTQMYNQGTTCGMYQDFQT